MQDIIRHCFLFFIHIKLHKQEVTHTKKYNTATKNEIFSSI